MTFILLSVNISVNQWLKKYLNNYYFLTFSYYIIYQWIILFIIGFFDISQIKHKSKVKGLLIEKNNETVQKAKEAVLQG